MSNETEASSTSTATPIKVGDIIRHVSLGDDAGFDARVLEIGTCGCGQPSFKVQGGRPRWRPDTVCSQDFVKVEAPATTATAVCGTCGNDPCTCQAQGDGNGDRAHPISRGTDGGGSNGQS